MAKRKAAKIHGILAIDKPAGPTSRGVLNDISRLFGERRCGHAGTLDPAATGVLVVAFGEATKVVRWLVEGGKSYRAVVQFGEQTSTDDAQGEVIAKAPCPTVNEARLLAVARRELGHFPQLPPAVSALRRDGVRDHERARRGEEVVRSPREVRLDDVRLVGTDGTTATFDLDTGPGFYVRAWARDLGMALGSVAHLAGLQRRRASCVDVHEALDMAALRQLSAEERYLRLQPVGEILRRRLPWLAVSEQIALMLQQGKKPAVACPGLTLPVDSLLIQSAATGRLICVARAEEPPDVDEELATAAPPPDQARLIVVRGFDPSIEIR